jgi:hypothetical protein
MTKQCEIQKFDTAAARKIARGYDTMLRTLALEQACDIIDRQAEELQAKDDAIKSCLKCAGRSLLGDRIYEMMLTALKGDETCVRQSAKDREIADLRSLVNGWQENADDLIEKRLTGMIELMRRVLKGEKT